MQIINISLRDINSDYKDVFYFLDHMLHREGGPAVKYMCDGRCNYVYYLKGVPYAKDYLEEYNKNSRFPIKGFLRYGLEEEGLKGY